MLQAPIHPLTFTLGPLLQSAAPALTLRPWRAEDAPELLKAWSDPDLSAGAPPPPARTMALAEAWIRGYEQRAVDGLALDLAIAPTDGRVVGEVGVAEFSPVRNAAVLGYWVAPEARGTGLASAAVQCFSDWALSGDGIVPGGLAALGARVAADNTASVRVLEKASFTKAGTRPDGTEIWLRRATGAA